MSPTILTHSLFFGTIGALGSVCAAAFWLHVHYSERFWCIPFCRNIAKLILTHRKWKSFMAVASQVENSEENEWTTPMRKLIRYMPGKIYDLSHLE